MFPRFHPHITHSNNLSFLKDFLPILISGVAVIISVVIPYLLLRYEKAFARNKGHKEFLWKMELFILDWLNVTSDNGKMIDKFLEVLKTPKTLFLKDFQFYEFPSMDFFDTYNVELVNECYVQVRKLKTLDHHIKTLSFEYLAYKRMLLEKENDKILNAEVFYTEALTSIKNECKTVFKDLTELRIIIRILLKKANKVNSLTFDKFFNFNPEKLIWHQKDIKFTQEEINEEKISLEKESKAYSKKTSPLS